MNARLPDAPEPAIVELRIPARAEWVAVARLAIAGVASRFDFSVEDIEDIKLAISEACTICIRRAQEGDQIEILCREDVGHLLVSVSSGVAGRLAVAHPDDSLALVIVESLMDRVELRSESAACLVEMSKRIAGGS
jgi:serine/threonine-protein kinase RsbW